MSDKRLLAVGHVVNGVIRIDTTDEFVSELKAKMQGSEDKEKGLPCRPGRYSFDGKNKAAYERGYNGQ